MAQPLRNLTVATLFGVAMLAAAMLAAGGGHGTSLFFAIYSSPLWVVSRRLALYGIPVLWALAGLLTCIPSAPARRWALLLFIALHYAGVGIAVAHPQLADWDGLRRCFAVPLGQFAVLGNALLYGAGQLLLWTRITSLGATTQTNGRRPVLRG